MVKLLKDLRKLMLDVPVPEVCVNLPRLLIDGLLVLRPRGLRGVIEMEGAGRPSGRQRWIGWGRGSNGLDLPAEPSNLGAADK